VNPVVPLALAAAAVLLAVAWSLRSARRAADAARAEAPDDELRLPAMPAMAPRRAPQQGVAAPPAPDPERAPLVPIGGTGGTGPGPGVEGASGTGGSLVALLGLPEALDADDEAPRPSASELPRLAAAAGSPFDGPELDLDAPEGIHPAPRSASTHPPVGIGRRRALRLPVPPLGGAAAAALWWFVAPRGDLPTVAHAALAATSGVVAGLGLGLWQEARTRGEQSRFERELLATLDRGGPWSLDAIGEAAPARGVLWEECRRAREAWWPEEDRHAVIVSARARRGGEWGRVLFALDEAERGPGDAGPLLAHTAEQLRERIAGADPPAGAGWAIALGIVVIAAAAAAGIAF
jgi:hypothetical protein